MSPAAPHASRGLPQRTSAPRSQREVRKPGGGPFPTDADASWGSVTQAQPWPGTSTGQRKTTEGRDTSGVTRPGQECPARTSNRNVKQQECARNRATPKTSPASPTHSCPKGLRSSPPTSPLQNNFAGFQQKTTTQPSTAGPRGIDPGARPPSLSVKLTDGAVKTRAKHQPHFLFPQP